MYRLAWLQDFYPVPIFEIFPHSQWPNPSSSDLNPIFPGQKQANPSSPVYPFRALDINCQLRDFKEAKSVKKFCQSSQAEKSNMKLRYTNWKPANRTASFMSLGVRLMWQRPLWRWHWKRWLFVCDENKSWISGACLDNFFITGMQLNKKLLHTLCALRPETDVACASTYCSRSRRPAHLKDCA